MQSSTKGADELYRMAKKRDGDYVGQRFANKDERDDNNRQGGLGTKVS